MYMTYGEAVNAEEMSARGICPRAWSKGAALRDIPQDEVVTYDDVDVPAGRLADRLRAEQYRHFLGETWLDERISAAV